MYKSGFLYSLTIALSFASAHAMAGAGVTSSGVTTSIPDTTSATQGVNTQSSNFVQDNQAINSGTTTGTTTTGSAIGTAMTANGKPGAAATDANGKPVDPNNPNAPKTDAQGKPIPGSAPLAVPAAPPAPPPEYVSNIKKVNRGETTGAAVVDVPVVGTPAKTDKSASDAPATGVNAGAPTAPGAQRQAVATPPRVARTASDADARGAGNTNTPAATGSSGGSGAAPDSYAFYIGIIIAGILLAFAAATFLRTERGGKP